jgi:hypothetical protein
LLKKHTEEYETQQKVLELALESLENSSKQSPMLTEEEKLCINLIQAKSVCIFEKNEFKILIENCNIELLLEF